ncbi:MAG: hypothetical protein ACKO5Q_09780, partial [Microcystaceae cyanobacterium]
NQAFIRRKISLTEIFGSPRPTTAIALRPWPGCFVWYLSSTRGIPRVAPLKYHRTQSARGRVSKKT